jgi:hypothetical protein
MNALTLPAEQIPEGISLEEAVELSSIDPDFYGHFFFPQATRGASPQFHKRMWDALLDSMLRWVAFMVFRGGAKTTTLRLFVSHRIAFGISRTILFVGKSQGAAEKSIRWLKNAVEKNTLWAQAFGLSRGDKWTEGEIEIYHGVDKVTITIIALGITGSTRGVNIDDYRPDLIVVDDPCDEENTATPEQRTKTAELFFAALAKSLAPRADIPTAKMVLLQTVLNPEDLISLTFKDRQWFTLRFSCFDNEGKSTWPQWFPTTELLEDKQGHIDRNQLSLWMREMECKCVSSETSAFLATWLEYWEIVPMGGLTILAIDPTPPPKDGDRQKITKKHDEAVIHVLRFHGLNCYLCESYAARAPNEEDLFEKVFELLLRWGPVQYIAFESVLFARTYANALEKAMHRKRMYVQVMQVEDRRPKETRIRQEVSGRASGHTLYVHRTAQAFIDQFVSYPDVVHDDYLDALAIGLASLNPALAGSVIEGDYTVLDNEPELPNWRTAP